MGNRDSECPILFNFPSNIMDKEIVKFDFRVYVRISPKKIGHAKSQPIFFEWNLKNHFWKLSIKTHNNSRTDFLISSDPDFDSTDLCWILWQFCLLFLTTVHYYKAHVLTKQRNNFQLNCTGTNRGMIKFWPGNCLPSLNVGTCFGHSVYPRSW